MATGVAASIVVIAIAILPFLTPAWVSFEQGRTHAASLAGYSDAELTVGACSAASMFWPASPP